MEKQTVLSAAVAEIRLSYSASIKPSQRKKVTCSADAVEALRMHWNAELLGFVEEFKIVLMARDNGILGIVPISQGGVSGTVADPKLIFAAALKANASSIILAHNHPSGNLKPSEADLKLTRKLKEAGTFLDLPVLDHIIITEESYYSFADEGVL